MSITNGWNALSPLGLHAYISFKRLITLFLATIFLSILFNVDGNVQAKSKTCARLEVELASLKTPSRPARNKKLVKRYDKAISVQKRQIKRAHRALSKNKCRRSTGVLLALDSARCRPIKRKLIKMNANAAKLISKRNQLAAARSKGHLKRRKSIQRSMIKARCGANDQLEARSRTIMEQVFGVKDKKPIQVSRIKRSKKTIDKSLLPISGSAETTLKDHNTFRTMCVRTCDGYYFPVSFSTNRNALQSDAAACEAMCPGAKMALYYHRTAGQTPENMISAKTGNPYSNLSTAFSYRKKFNPSCRCNYQQVKNRSTDDNSEQDGLSKPSSIVASNSRQFVPVPKARVFQQQDPETLQNLRFAFDIEDAKALELPVMSPTPDTKLAKRRVRVIGEEFFPSQ